MPDTQAIQAHWKTTLVILTLSAVLMSLSYTMLIPFLPMYLIEELGVEQSRANFWSGLVFSVSFLISGVMAPIWGAMADKRSRKLMALRAAILLAVSYALGGIVQNEWQLLAMRCFQGFASGLWPACLAIMASTVPRERIGLAMGIMQGGMTAGGVLGPFFGGALAELFSMRMTFFIGGAALAVITLLILFFIHEPPRKEQKKAAAAGFEWPDVQGALDKLEEEVAELRRAVENGGDVPDELGDVLFAAVKGGRFCGCGPEDAVNGTCEKFIHRFRAVEEGAAVRGREVSQLSLEEMTALWDEAKRS